MTSLYAALEVATGRVLGECAARHTEADFLAFLKLVARRYRGRPLHIIPDNSSTHSTTAVQGWLVRHPHVRFQFTPKGARSRPAYPAQTSTSGTLIPTPFIWTREPADSIKKAVRHAH